MYFNINMQQQAKGPRKQIHVNPHFLVVKSAIHIYVYSWYFLLEKLQKPMII